MQGIAVVLGDAGADGFVVENLVVVDYIGTPVADVVANRTFRLSSYSLNEYFPYNPLKII